MKNTRRPELANLKGDSKAYLKAYYELRKGDTSERTCSRCGETKPREDFSDRQTQCKPCRRIIEQERYEHNKERMRDRSRERKFGLTPGQYQEMFDTQGGLCAICEQPETTVRKGLLQALPVDHDHDTGKVRALLCNKCNSRLHAGEDIDWYYKAAAYLQRHA
jgi:hypothetical protein